MPQQSSNYSSQLAAMQRLDWLVGTWEGASWMSLPSGTKGESVSTEIIERKLDGLLLQIEGTHIQQKATPDAPKHTNLSTVALISYDHDTGRYRFDSYTHNGDHGIFDGELIAEHTFRWILPQGSRTIRYDISLHPDGSWFEIGEISSDNKAWNKFFQMTLKKTNTLN